MTLKTFREFRSSLQQLPAFKSIHPKDRQGFLSDAYKLAKDKCEKEQWMETTARELARSSRASSTQELRSAQHVWNALVEINKAKQAAPTDQPTLIHCPQIDEAYESLRTTYDDLGFLIGMDIAAIHPHHRTAFEKRFRTTYPQKFCSVVEEKFTDIPARRSRFDYLLVAGLNSRLDKCATSDRPLRPIDRYRIISQVFLAALQQTYDVGTIKTALRRTSAQQSM